MREYLLTLVTEYLEKDFSHTFLSWQRGYALSGNITSFVPRNKNLVTFSSILPFIR